MQRQRKSATITNYDREQISNKIAAMFFKTAKSRDPDPTFHKRISKQIIQSWINQAADAIRSDQPLDHVPTMNIRDFLDMVKNQYLPDDCVISVFAPIADNTRAKLLSSRAYLEDVDAKELNISGLQNDIIPLIMFDNMHFDYRMHVAFTLKVDPEYQEKIENHNNRMNEVFDDMAEQLTTMLKKLDGVRTTSTFEKLFPGLTALYPESVKRKLDAINPEKELTEEQKILKAATNMIVASELIDE